MKANRRSGGRLRESRPRQGPLTVFVHIPKTAGTSFAAVLGDNFPGGVRNLGNTFMGSGGFDPGPARRLGDAPSLRTRHVQVLTGHLPFGIRDRLPADTRYLTFLRDPVERTLSHYYGLLKPNRRTRLPGDGSLQAVLADGGLIFDNLQTRMLSDSDEPLGDADDAMLEQAKENLRTGFTAFGLVERFDESLVLFQRRVGLRSLVYAQQRVGKRPRGSEVPEEDVQLVERFNPFDIELYRWASELFEQLVGGDELDFAADVAALRLARGGEPAHDVPERADRDALWQQLVRARCELLVDRRESVRSARAERGELRDLLVSLREDLGELGKGRSAPVVQPAGKRGGRAGNKRSKRSATNVAEVERLLDGAAAALAQVNKRIAKDDDGREQQKLQAAELGARIEQLSSRAAQVRERVGEPGGE